MFKRVTERAKQAPLLLLLTLAALAVMALPAWADTSIPYAHQISDLITRGGEWLTGIIGGTGGLMFGYHAVMRNFLEDPQSVGHHTASMRKVAIGTGLGAGASGLSTWLYNEFSGGGSTGTATGMLLHSHTVVALVTKVFGA